MLAERDCKHGRQMGKCSDCDLDQMTMAAESEAQRVDELTALRKQDEALIRQMLEALEGAGAYTALLDDFTLSAVRDAISAARARLGEKGDSHG